MNKKHFKRVVMVIFVLMLAFSFAGCGDKINPNNYVTVEKYEELRAADWGDMSFKEMEKFLDVQGIVDEEGTADWGEGYTVVDFPGPDTDSYLHVLFGTDDDGKESASSMSPTGKLAEN